MAKIVFIGEPRASQFMTPTFLLLKNAVDALGYSSVVVSDFWQPPSELAAEYDLAICMRTLMFGKVAAVNALKGWNCNLKLGNAQYGQWLSQVSSPLKALPLYMSLDAIPADQPFFMKNIRGVKFGPFGYRKFANVAEFTSAYSASQIDDIFKGAAIGVNYLQPLIPDTATFNRAVVMSSGSNAHLLATYSAVGAPPLNMRSAAGGTEVAITVPASDPTALTPNLTMPFTGDMEWFTDASGVSTLIEVNTRLPRISALATYLMYGPDVFKDWLDCTINRKPWTPAVVNPSITIRSSRDATQAATDGFKPVPYGDIIPAGAASFRAPLFYK